jgi:hypothetical protein
MDSKRRTENKRVEKAMQQMAVKMAVRSIPEIFARVREYHATYKMISCFKAPLESLLIICKNLKSKIKNPGPVKI